MTCRVSIPSNCPVTRIRSWCAVRFTGICCSAQGRSSWGNRGAETLLSCAFVLGTVVSLDMFFRMKMKQFGLAVVIALILVACSSREDPESKNRPISIHKTQIDLANSDSMVDAAPAGAPIRFFMLTNTLPEDEKAKWRLIGLSGRNVQIRDGREVLGTGKIKHVLLGKPGEELAVSIVFPSQEALEDLEKKLGFQWRFICNPQQREESIFEN